jgi:hypothetical protein
MMNGLTQQQHVYHTVVIIRMIIATILASIISREGYSNHSCVFPVQQERLVVGSIRQPWPTTFFCLSHCILALFLYYHF